MTQALVSSKRNRPQTERGGPDPPMNLRSDPSRVWLVLDWVSDFGFRDEILGVLDWFVLDWVSVFGFRG